MNLSNHYCTNDVKIVLFPFVETMKTPYLVTKQQYLILCYYHVLAFLSSSGSYYDLKRILMGKFYRKINQISFEITSERQTAKSCDARSRMSTL